MKIDNPVSVRQGEELDINKLSSYVASQVPDFGQIVEVKQFPGGYSNLTYFLKTDADRAYVLRRPPFGAKHIKGGHDMGREFRVLSALQTAGYFKVPKVLLFCEDDSILDCPFYIMERVQGVVLRAQTAPKMAIEPTTMRQMSEALVDNMVALHSIDIYQTGLIALGKPEGYIQRQVEGWQKRYVNSQTDDITAMTELYAWLVKNMPADGPPTLLHNDYKYDNVILNTQDLSEIVAVLDWEMCTVGDPLMDLGTSLSYWSEDTDDAFAKSFNFTWLPGNLTRAEFAQRYAQKSGRDVSNLLYFYVFGLFKNAVVIQQIYARWKNGFSKDERFANLLLGVQSLSHTATKAIERGSL
ncbi:MAG: phosphotransferase family protein [Runella slithyformis]|nr:MAG: phosphotransferase family protein [Runella slithyformis]TAF29836.1 MAG: phosphotransferase family protein [Runella slithyformis]TAF48813.1 MAG: phosphotransferase family protein [Runella slithyformis]TAF83396.1 MAG: phosphotransferase family protein [Runella slithyformis]